jgi:hypothetical protein
MNNQEQLEAIKDIRNMMQRNERFISLSGWSGVSAGICAIIGGYFAHRYMFAAQPSDVIANNVYYRNLHGDIPLLSLHSLVELAQSRLLQIAVLTLITALISAFLFTYLRAKKTNNKLWGITTRKLFLHFAIPLAVGGIFIYKLIILGYYDLIAASCLLFYGAALLSASHYSSSELRYLAICEFILGIICLFTLRFQLWIWIFGFGFLHIVYGVVMWYRYERNV